MPLPSSSWSPRIRVSDTLQNNLRAAAEYDATLRLAQFRELRARGALCTEVTEQLATEAATAFLDRFESLGEYLGDAITLLAEISTLEEPCLAEPGQRATFPLLVERLSDSFAPQYCLLYDRAFSQMITVCRRLPSATKLDAALRRFGLNSERDLLERKARLRKRPPMLDARERQRVKKVLVLSRVTLGADVAITSVVWQKARQSFPQAELVLLGSPKLLQLFGGDGSLRIHKIQYQAAGGLLDRLASWLPVAEAVEEETKTLRPEEFVVIDPDSRLLQLGLLPALQDESRYFFLESRCFGEPGQGSMSQITLRWLNSMFGGPDASNDDILPAVSLRSEDKEFGRELCRKLRQGGSSFLVAASFGVGGNRQKRLPDPFEEELLLRLLEEGSTVLLDKGAGEEELDRASRLVERVKASGRTVIEADRESASRLSGPEPICCQMLTWQGEIGAFSALVGESDEYIGYDSAGQHIAAALGVPTIDIFTEAASVVFQERWRPCGRGIVKVAGVAFSGGKPPNAETVIAEVVDSHRANHRGS